jgi:hypothetical protein
MPSDSTYCCPALYVNFLLLCCYTPWPSCPRSVLAMTRHDVLRVQGSRRRQNEPPGGSDGPAPDVAWRGMGWAWRPKEGWASRC